MSVFVLVKKGGRGDLYDVIGGLEAIIVFVDVNYIVGFNLEV